MQSNNINKYYKWLGAIVFLLMFNFSYAQISTTNTVQIPNAFTPNGDGINDEFAPNLNGFTVTSYEIKIYNRWGVLLFTSQNNNVNWDGKTNAGVKCTEGTYFYIIKINGIEYKGAVLLLN